MKDEFEIKETSFQEYMSKKPEPVPEPEPEPAQEVDAEVDVPQGHELVIEADSVAESKADAGKDLGLMDEYGIKTVPLSYGGYTYTVNPYVAQAQSSSMAAAAQAAASAASAAPSASAAPVDSADYPTGAYDASSGGDYATSSEGAYDASSGGASVESSGGAAAIPAVGAAIGAGTQAEESAPHRSTQRAYSGQSSRRGSVQTLPEGSGPQTAPAKTRSKVEKKPGYVTRKGFVIAMLCGMLATSGLTIGGLGLAGAFDKVVVPETASDTLGNAAVPSTQEADPPAATSPANYDLSTATGSALSIQEIIAKNENAVVEIQTEAVITDSWLQNYVTQGAGSGTLISEDGYILTCNHVIEDSTSITVTLKDGSTHDAVIIGRDPLTDVAVIKIEGSGFTYASYGNSDGLSIGDLVVAIGNPLGELGGSATTGIISSLDRELTVDGKKMTLLQTDASINPGNSGGGLFDGSGNLIGVVVAKSSGSDIEGLGFAIPINKASEIAGQLIENGNVQGNALIGVNVLDLTDASDAMQYGVRNTGIYITDVTSQEAQAAGFEAGDMIYYVGDYEIDSEAALRSALANYEPGDTVVVTVIRNNRTVDITTVLVEAG